MEILLTEELHTLLMQSRPTQRSVYLVSFKIDLSENPINDEGALIIAEALICNKRIWNFMLSQTNLSASGILKFCCVLEGNKVLYRTVGITIISIR